ncbi:restriction endonuclease subunit S [Pectobacterium odoriferum]|uniref:restriction endonuclease subunit S n=1 Tax=Pectobacterium odoriferum TaxID=78398 RepID=UPI000CD18DA2|nr:restriction endonuclease subunit S [Pectobacterium odoriferum]POD92410.1 restriction endonuclease [Pectobacterium odoriferum]
MTSDFYNTTIGEQITLQRGFDITKKEQKEGRIPVVSSGGVSSYHNVAKVSGPGVILGRKGTLGTVFFIEEDYWPHDTTLWVKDFKGNNPSFVYYFFKNISKQLKSMDVGAANPALNRNHVHPLEITWPRNEVQDHISKILSSLDKKIKNNDRVNQTLEKMAQALFKSWFVDFEPVKAKMAVLDAGGSQEDATLAAMTAISGKETDALMVFEREHPEQYVELKATAELFPSAMQECELGKIPVSWTLSEIGKEIGVAGGATPSTKTSEFWENGDINWTTPKDLSNIKEKVLLQTEKKITKNGLAKISSGLLPINTVLMSSRAPVGYLALAKIPAAINQGYIAMKCNKDLSPEFVLQWCVENMPEIVSRASGTTFAEISKKNFNPIPLVKPPANIVRPYTKQVSVIYSLIENNVRENNSLIQLRDSLLPKLLSGEITLPEAEQAVKEVEHV